jgi:hypothetical protein
MKRISPKYKDTYENPKSNEWIPKTFEKFIEEIEHLTSQCKSTGSLPLFRGHRERKWLIDSTFTRSFKATIFGLPAGEKLNEYVVNSPELHYSALNLFLLKYGILVRPSEELESVSFQNDLDSWFELMKRYQQYPEEDSFFLKGTNIIDWSQSFDVALYFANKKREGEGAIFICDATATGKTLQTKPMGEILDKMKELGNSGKALGMPLLFCPKKQITCKRARNQQAIYFAQMDLRYDLESIWKIKENSLKGENIITKVVLPDNSKDSADEYLEKKGISHDFVFPDLQT